MVQQTDTYKTTETPLAAYLILNDHANKGITYEPNPFGQRPRASFLFDNSDELQALVQQYNSGKAVGNIALYEHTKSQLLDRVMRGMP